MTRTIADIRDPELRAAAERLEEGRPLDLRERMWIALEAAFADGAGLTWHDHGPERAAVLNDWAKARDLVAHDSEIEEPSTGERPYVNRCVKVGSGHDARWMIVYNYRPIVGVRLADWRPADEVAA